MQFSHLVRLGCLMASGWATMVSPIAAFVVSSTQQNTTRPQDDPGWDNVALVNGSTGVYLGNRWMITAAHVGARSAVFPELGRFEPDPGSVFRLQNPPDEGLSLLTDLVLFQLLEDPGLPPIRLAVQTPPAGAEVITIGNGKDRAADLTFWDVTKGGSWTWKETEVPSDYSGYKTVATNSLRWGDNLLENEEPFRRERDDDITTVIETSGDVVMMITEFDGDDGKSNSSIKGPDGLAETAFESQAVINDSGGGLFYKNNGYWELAGITLALEGHKDQPSLETTAIFGNLTFYADIATYVDQIETHYRLGDFDGDAQLTVDDIDALTYATLSGTYDPTFDLNRDGSLDRQDRTIWVEDLRWTYFGDTNLDGLFDSQDLVGVMQAGEYEDGVTGNSSWATGDWTGDLEFSSTDFVRALQAGGYEQGPRTLSAHGAIVPEPVGPAGVVLAAIFLLATCRRAERAGGCAA